MRTLQQVTPAVQRRFLRVRSGWGPAPQASRGTGLSQKQKAELEMQEYRKKTDCALKQLSSDERQLFYWFGDCLSHMRLYG